MDMILGLGLRNFVVGNTYDSHPTNSVATKGSQTLFVAAEQRLFSLEE